MRSPVFHFEPGCMRGDDDADYEEEDYHDGYSEDSYDLGYNEEDSPLEVMMLLYHHLLLLDRFLCASSSHRTQGRTSLIDSESFKTLQPLVLV
ncbi:hypothetical protein HanRHA438_Chr03g0120781 [Helianthus annuus]|nr:hypothetical protein HanRHA438_Chr03g0120781 [Helianthus annuus]